jgi:Tol biopolymer transport system component
MGRGRLRKVAVGVAVLVLGFAGAQARAAAPANDNRANALDITPLGVNAGTTTASTLEATKEAGEADHAGDQGGASVWFRWTPGFTGTAFVDTSGSAIDTLLDIYTPLLGTQTRPVNDDADDTTTTSRVCFHVDAGTPFDFAVDGYAGETGAVTVHWGQRTDSAPCANTAPLVTGASAGHPRVGDVLSASLAGFAGDAPITFQWLRCTELQCEEIGGATNQIHPIGAADVGFAIRVDETMSDGTASASQTSDPTTAVVTTPATHQNGRIFWTTSRDSVFNSGSSNFEIYSSLPDDTSLQRVTNRAGFDSFPVVSPTGRRLVFRRDTRLAFMDPDGRNLVQTSLDGLYPTWSPDGSRVAYAAADGIHIVGAGGTDDSVLIFLGGQVPTGIDWSPDGGTIAFTYTAPGNTQTDIATIAADGRGAITRLTTTADFDRLPAWSPTGDRLLFIRSTSSNTTDDLDLWVMDADGTNAHRLIDGGIGTGVQYADFSPDGTRIVLSRDIAVGSDDLFTIPAAGGAQTPVANHVDRDELPSWAPAVRYSLDVSRSGDGTGSVSSSTAGIACGSSCSASFADGSSVVLTATAGAGSTFAGWSGACSGTGTCSVAVVGDRSVGARFDAPAASTGGGSGGTGGGSGGTGGAGTGTGGGGGGGGGVPPEIGVTAGFGPQPQGVGDVFAYSLTLYNDSIQGSELSVVTVNLPPDVQYVSAKVERGSGCQPNGQTLTCSLDFFPGKLTTTVIVTVKVTAARDLPVSASVYSLPTDSNPANDTASLTVHVGAAQATVPTTTTRTEPPPPTPHPAATTPTPIVGTTHADRLTGTSRGERIAGGGGNDRITPGGGPDTVWAGAGDDTVFARDGVRDTIDCGAGRDTVFADRLDVVARNCELVRRTR